jgi:hypothetical protein
MVLRRKPKTEDEFLSQGSTVLDSNPETKIEIVEDRTNLEVKFLARVPAKIVDLIDFDRKSELPKQSRNSWLINAAVNELKRRGKM